MPASRAQLARARLFAARDARYTALRKISDPRMSKILLGSGYVQ